MSFRGSGVALAKNCQMLVEVSQTNRQHTNQITGRVVADIEVAPHDNALLSLGTYSDSSRPKGICIEFDANAKVPAQSVSAHVTATEVSSGSQYLLQINNDTQYMLCAEVRLL